MSAPFTIESTSQYWDIYDSTGAPIAGAPKGVAAATMTGNTVLIDGPAGSEFAGDITAMSGLAAGTPLTKFKDLLNTHLSGLIGGITSIVAGAGISVSTVSGVATITNTGVITPYTAGNGIAITGSSIAANLAAGTNISLTGTNPITINEIPTFNGQTMQQYWVSAGGSDATGNGSPDNPFATMAHAIMIINGLSPPPSSPRSCTISSWDRAITATTS